MMMSMIMMISRPYVGILGMNMKEASYLIDVGIPNSCNNCSIMSKRFKKYADLKEEQTKV